MAGLWKLPVIYVVENNQMSMGTQLHRHSAVTDLAQRGGPPYGFPGVTVDANDIEAMAEVTLEAANRARAGEGPTFIEAKTYRYRGHSMSDPMKYRTKEELDKARERDPIALYEVILRERGWVDDEALEQLQAEVKDLVDDAITFAEEAEQPELDEVYTDITVSPPHPPGVTVEGGVPHAPRLRSLMMAGPTTESFADDFKTFTSAMADVYAESAHSCDCMESGSEPLSSNIKTLLSTTERLSNQVKPITTTVADFREEFAYFRGRVEGVLGILKWLGSFVAVSLLGCIGAVFILTWEAAKLDSRVDAYSDRMDRVEASLDRVEASIARTMRILELRDTPAPTTGESETDLR